MRVATGGIGFSQSATIVVSPHCVSALVSALMLRIEQFTRKHAGFVSARVQVSELQVEVHLQLFWASKGHGERAFACLKDGEVDLIQLFCEFQVSAVSFRTFVVCSEVLNQR